MKPDDNYRQKRQAEKDEALKYLRRAVSYFDRRDPDHWQQVILTRALRAFMTGCYADATSNVGIVMIPPECRSQVSAVHPEPVNTWNKDVFTKDIEATYAAPLLPQFQNSL